MIFTFTIPGKAVPQGRGRAARIHTKTGREFVKVMDESKSRNWKAYIKYLAAHEMQRSNFEGFSSISPLRMRVMVVMVRPKKPKNPHWPIVKPDVSNIIKGIEDALNGLVYPDDSQLVEIAIRKQYGDLAETHVQICQIGEGKEIVSDENERRIEAV